MRNENLILEITDSLRSRLGDGYDITSQGVLKNNDTELIGIVIRKQDSNIAPTIYIDRIVDDYQQKRITFDGCVEKIIDIYRSNSGTPTFETPAVTDFEDVKNKICLSLVNTDRNQKRLRDIPHISFLDLSIIFQIPVFINQSAEASITVRQNYMDMWGVTAKDLYSLALKNTEKLFPAEITSITEILSGMCEFTEPLPEELPMFILTNNRKCNGAICILYKDVLRDFADKLESDLYILPSSTHETIIVPVSTGDDGLKLSEMVREINANVVAAEEVLSDNAYIYTRKNNEITIINQRRETL